jgi:hypothetical protein
VENEVGLTYDEIRKQRKNMMSVPLTMNQFDRDLKLGRVYKHCNENFDIETKVGVLKQHLADKVHWPIMRVKVENMISVKQPTLVFSRKAAVKMPEGVFIPSAVLNNILLLLAMVTSTTPLNLVDNVYFGLLVATANLGLARRATLTTKYLPLIYTLMFNAVRRKIKANDSKICLSFDIWGLKLRSKFNFIGIIGQYMDEYFDNRIVMLGQVSFNIRDTGENLAEKMTEIMQDFDIPKQKLAGMVTDSDAANIKAIKKILRFEHIRCLLHVLH